MHTILANQNSVFNSFIAEIRDRRIQQDSMRFRRNLERMGEIFAYEISKGMTYASHEVTTPLGIATVDLPQEQPVLVTILRAGLPLHQGLLNYFDKSENAFISAYRKHHKDGSFDVQVEYLSSPELTNKTVILSDPMLATGTSILLAYKALLKRGTPSKLHVVTAIGSMQGLQFIESHLPSDTHIWLGALDEELTAQSYIVPGLGDAGDLAFGKKI
jgi:uracil phosphoribosyltransferase